MDNFNVLAAVIERPDALSGDDISTDAWRSGLSGYALAALGTFVFFRMFSLIPPGILSFLVLLLFMLSADLLLAAVTHLFMELTGAGGRAARLFLAFGYADFFLILLVPLGFFAKWHVLSAFWTFCLCAALVIYARIVLVRRLYPVSANKAALAVWLPYAAFMGLGIFGLSYFIVWLLWLVG